MRTVLVVVALGGLGACAEQPKQVQVASGQGTEASVTASISAPAPDPISQLKAKLAANAVEDLQGAIELAKGVNDKAGLQCYTWELGVALTLGGASASAAPGFGLKTPLTDFEKLRAARLSLNSGSGLASDFNLNCAALFNDVVVTLARFGVRVGGIVGTGGLGAPALGVLGVVNQSLPIPIPGL